MAIYCLTSVTGAIQLAGLDWYCGKGHRDPNSPSLAVCFDNGRAQLMKYELDPGEICHVYPECYIRVFVLIYTGTLLKEFIFLVCTVPIKIDTGIMVSCIKWNIDGKLLAFAGTQTSSQVRWWHSDIK